MASRCPKSEQGGPSPIYIPTISHLGPSGGETKRPTLQADHSDQSGLVKHALVLGSGGHISLDTPMSVSKAQGFSDAMAARVWVPQRS